MNDGRRRVVVTGMGCVTASGLGVGSLWTAARDGVSAVRPLALPHSPKQRVKAAAHLPDFDAAGLIDDDRLRMIDRFAAFALVAAQEALGQAGLGADPLGERCGVIVGNGIGGVETIDAGHRAFYTGDGRADPMAVPKVMPNAATSQISMRHGAKGPSFCVSSACSSGSQAVGLGLQLIRSGAMDMALVGGTEALLAPVGFRAWELLRVMTPSLCRPFSKQRDGMVLGEGAAVLVIEERAMAEARGAEILAEIVGYGTTSDAADLLRPDPEGAARAMTMALDDAGLLPGDIGYINAHGTGTIANDIAEVEALRRAFGPALDAVHVSSTKPIHGHTLGAAGAIELAVTIMALGERMAPPTLNWLGLDPKCGIDPVSGSARPFTRDAAISNSFAFGGINVSLVVRAAG